MMATFNGDGFPVLIAGSVRRTKLQAIPFCGFRPWDKNSLDSPRTLPGRICQPYCIARRRTARRIKQAALGAGRVQHDRQRKAQSDRL